jgi:methionyl-tRNA synthetase
MLLAASDRGGAEGEERCEVLDAGDAPTGTRVVLEGFPPDAPPPAEIDIDTFFSVPLEVRGGVVTAGGRALTLNGKPLRTRIIADGGVR